MIPPGKRWCGAIFSRDVRRCHVMSHVLWCFLAWSFPLPRLSTVTMKFWGQCFAVSRGGSGERMRAAKKGMSLELISSDAAILVDWRSVALAFLSQDQYESDRRDGDGGRDDGWWLNMTIYEWWCEASAYQHWFQNDGGSAEALWTFWRTQMIPECPKFGFTFGVSKDYGETVKNLQEHIFWMARTDRISHCSMDG